jgi:hypothetical protein
MRRAGLPLALLSLAAVTAAPAELNVSLRGDLMDIRSQGASVFEILNQISRQTGMQVVPDGAPPATPVSLVLEGRTPAEIVLSVLESAGVGYAAQLDRTGQKVTRVMLVRPGAAAPSAGTQTRPSVRPVPAARPEPPVREESPEPEEAEPREPPVPPEAGRGQQAMEAAPPPASMQSQSSSFWPSISWTQPAPLPAFPSMPAPVPQPQAAQPPQLQAAPPPQQPPQ